jgi:hypothetical protein
MASRYLFFSGKGGVGKTTMACATAVQEAEIGVKTLIVTTDPASNLADVFEQPIGHQVTAIAGVKNLWAMEIDPDKATDEYRERILGPFRQVMPEDVIRLLEEQFRSPCTTEIATFDRFVDFMDGSDFDVVIFDTAPTGHTNPPSRTAGGLEPVHLGQRQGRRPDLHGSRPGNPGVEGQVRPGHHPVERSGRDAVHLRPATGGDRHLRDGAIGNRTETDRHPFARTHRQCDSSRRGL